MPIKLQSSRPEPDASNPVIGRFAIVEDLKHAGHKHVRVTVIDNIFGTRLPKRVRIQEGEHQGDVLMRNEYILAEWL